VVGIPVGAKAGLDQGATRWRNAAEAPPKKIVMARRLRAETTLTLQWIAAEFDMGSWTEVSDLLGQKQPKGVINSLENSSLTG